MTPTISFTTKSVPLYVEAVSPVKPATLILFPTAKLWLELVVTVTVPVKVVSATPTILVIPIASSSKVNIPLVELTGPV